MKDFDSDRRARLEQARTVDRSFTIGGQIFERRISVMPEALLPLDMLKAPVLAEDGRTVIEAGSSISDDFAAIDAVILAHIDTDADPTAEERYLEVRANTEDIIDAADLRRLMDWLVNEDVGRPTGRPGNSSGSRERTGTGSTADSSRQAAAA